MLYQLSYEATDVGSRSIVRSYISVKEMSDLFHILLTQKQNSNYILGFYTFRGAYATTTATAAKTSLKKWICAASNVMLAIFSGVQL